MTDRARQHTVIDPDRERQRWDRSGPFWDRWADAMADPADRINRPLLERLDLRPGHRLLDLAAGAGEPALTAASLVGPDGLVLATDLAPAMLTGARRRAGTAPSLVFGAADMTRLPFADASMDRVSCRLGLMFVPDDRQAVEEMRRVLRPGGRAAVAVWGPRTDNTLFAELGRVVAGHLGPDADQALEVLFRHADPGRTADLFRQAGFSDVSETAVLTDAATQLDRPFWRPALEMVFGPLLQDLPMVIRQQIDTDIVRAFARLAGSDGKIYLRMHARLAAAITPTSV